MILMDKMTNIKHPQESFAVFAVYTCKKEKSYV